MKHTFTEHWLVVRLQIYCSTGSSHATSCTLLNTAKVPHFILILRHITLSSSSSSECTQAIHTYNHFGNIFQFLYFFNRSHTSIIKCTHAFIVQVHSYLFMFIFTRFESNRLAHSSTYIGTIHPEENGMLYIVYRMNLVAVIYLIVRGIHIAICIA